MTSLSRGKLALKESIKTSAKYKRRSPASWAEFWCKAGLDQEGLIKRVVSKRVGYGVFTTKKFLKGEFLLEYMGERINSQEANKREKLDTDEQVEVEHAKKLSKTAPGVKCKGKKRPWSAAEEACLKKRFKFYLGGTRSSVHNADMIEAQEICEELSRRTLPQIRAKLNNIKLGKSQ